MSWQQVCFDYDGSYPGFLTCVFESYAHREEAVCFTSPEDGPPHPLAGAAWWTPTRPRRSGCTALCPKRSPPEACRLVTQAFLTCLPERELHMYRFLRLGYQRGADIIRDLTDDRVHVLWKAVQHLGSEAHLLKGFLRFSDQQGVLVGEIEPKNRVLPLLRPHFCTRVLRGALPHLRPHPPGAADPSARSVGHSARGRLCPCPAGAGGGDLPASVEAVL